MLRIGLILAIVASALTLVVSHLQLAQQIQAQKQDLENTRSNLDRTSAELRTAQGELRDANDALETCTGELTTTKEVLANTQQEAQQQRQRADRTEKERDTALSELTQSQRELASWKALAIPVDQVRSRLAELVQVTRANQVLDDEKKVMMRKIDELQATVDFYVGPRELPPKLPDGLKGTVLVVNPQWDFVILDIGGDQGVKNRGELLVNRGGKLVAKVRVTKVEANRSIANVMPEWKQADVQEGDQVLPSLNL